jgi:hypothetical protein
MTLQEYIESRQPVSEYERELIGEAWNACYQWILDSFDLVKLPDYCECGPGHWIGPTLGRCAECNKRLPKALRIDEGE